MNDILTVKELSKKLGVTRAKAYYAIDKAGIEPRGRAGSVALYSPDQVPLIEAALKNVRPYVVQSCEEKLEKEKTNG